MKEIVIERSNGSGEDKGEIENGGLVWVCRECWNHVRERNGYLEEIGWSLQMI